MQFKAFLVAAATMAGLSVGQSTTAPTNGTVVTRTVTAFTTYCPGPTTVVVNSQTYTVTAATTLTITNCPCVITTTYPFPPGATPVRPITPGTPGTPGNPGTPGGPVNPPPAVAGAEARYVAYSFAVAAAGVVGAAFAL